MNLINSQCTKDNICMKAVNIKWDTDGDMELLKELPTEMELPEGLTNTHGQARGVV